MQITIISNEKGISLETSQYIKKDSKKQVKNPPAMQETEAVGSTPGSGIYPGGGDGHHSRII